MRPPQQYDVFSCPSVCWNAAVDDTVPEIMHWNYLVKVLNRIEMKNFTTLIRIINYITF